ncbi:hypothetical protein SSP24_76690 [Streptomyces spinoverrucosus]|uniref:Uncharacterized protein n=1 Tax=Streptomyces spinoverrucosus TaxID=284043 RepID=A0A4Y3VSS9_9ACTN|nr:hypothetical protein [Streptomyces spinoverrucosus]GEC10014.1 hypothetical protein SSP24_76690 [Streptomyces spinoverrucosus]GHB75140.1 hypothetical protein GCM10010397_51870 [Streptomyces spinoverrucosus]
MAVFLWCWIGLFTAVLLPLGIAMLRGWAPKRARTQWSPARIRVQGVSALVLYGGGLLPAVADLTAMPREAADLLLSMTTPHLVFLSLGLQGGAALSDWFGRRTGPWTGPSGAQG